MLNTDIQVLSQLSGKNEHHINKKLTVNEFKALAETIKNNFALTKLHINGEEITRGCNIDNIGIFNTAPELTASLEQIIAILERNKLIYAKLTEPKDYENNYEQFCLDCLEKLISMVPAIHADDYWHRNIGLKNHFDNVFQMIYGYLRQSNCQNTSLLTKFFDFYYSNVNQILKYANDLQLKHKSNTESRAKEIKPFIDLLDLYKIYKDRQVIDEAKMHYFFKSLACYWINSRSNEYIPLHSHMLNGAQPEPNLLYGADALNYKNAYFFIFDATYMLHEIRKRIDNPQHLFADWDTIQKLVQATMKAIINDWLMILRLKDSVAYWHARVSNPFMARLTTLKRVMMISSLELLPCIKTLLTELLDSHYDQHIFGFNNKNPEFNQHKKLFEQAKSVGELKACIVKIKLNSQVGMFSQNYNDYLERLEHFIIILTWFLDNCPQPTIESVSQTNPEFNVSQPVSLPGGYGVNDNPPPRISSSAQQPYNSSPVLNNAAYFQPSVSSSQPRLNPQERILSTQAIADLTATQLNSLLPDVSGFPRLVQNASEPQEKTTMLTPRGRVADGE